MAALTMKELLEAGVHFGHQTKRWNPKMQKYIFGERNGIYIIDLQKTLKKFREAYAFVRDLAADGRHRALRRHQEAGPGDGARGGRPAAGMFYVNHRWLGGTLTNFTTIRKSIARLKKLDEMKETGEYERLPKKEVLGLEREREKLAEARWSASRTWTGCPPRSSSSTPRRRRSRWRRRAGWPSRSSPSWTPTAIPPGSTIPMPGNDDAIRAVRLITSRIADAIIEGRGTPGQGGGRGGDPRLAGHAGGDRGRDDRSRRKPASA